MLHFRRNRWVTLGALLVLAGCTKGQSIGPSSESSGKEETDDDKADTSAPVSGAYLTCYVPPPKDTDEYIVGGCQARDKNKSRLDLSKNKNVKWGFLPPKGAKSQVALAVYDMSHAKSQRYFDVVYQLKIPPKSATGLTQGTSRKDLGAYFLNSVPVLSTRLTLLSEARKTQKQGTPVNALSLTAVQNTFREISARFPDPQSAPQTPAAMLNTNAAGQPVNDETFPPISLQPLNFQSVDQITYDQPGQQAQDEDQGQYTTISGDPYYETGGTEVEQSGYEDPYGDFSGSDTGGDLGSGESGGDLGTGEGGGDLGTGEGGGDLGTGEGGEL